MRDFIAKKWTVDTPEYRKLSMTKKHSLIKKVNNLSIKFKFNIMLVCNINLNLFKV